ncbi:endo alpha-1,4 polygalactosaminidase [Sphingomonas sp. NCPPB 2930]|uniref:endo alpha-1,4 polygalactosaminidase n=1 Tax=Sphingomonas sp. NCPPB 2930 TaxID=3162788 RepID=UPI0036D9E624
MGRTRKHRSLSRIWRLGVACTALAMVGACGGGAADGDPVIVTPTPVPSPTPTATPTPSAGGWWRPERTLSWQWQLSGTLNTGYAVAAYDIDLFDSSATTIADLHRQGRRVICYFSAGSSENWRPDDAQFASGDRGKALSGWAGERWLRIDSAGVRKVMAARLDLARAKGCDAVEPDNVDGYANDNGLGLTAAMQLDYNRFLAAEAHGRGLAIGLKNDTDQIAALQPAFDFALNEQCHEFSECGGYSAFLDAGKPVLVAEYADRYRSNSGGARDAMCAASRQQGVRTLVLALALDDSYRFSCDNARPAGS